MERKRKRHRLNGRYMLTLGALALMGLSGYALWSWLRDQRISFEGPELRAVGFKLLFLVATLVLGIACIGRRNRAKGAWLLMVLAVALAGLGVFLGVYSLRPWAQLLKLIPLALIMAGCVMNYIHRAELKEHHHHHHHHHHHSRRH